VRCGNCLRVFDATSGDIDFVAPVLRETDESDPLAGFTVKPMSGAQLPRQQQPASRREWAILAVLVIMLAVQMLLRLDATSNQQQMSISQLIVRKQPQQENALRLDAILRNAGDASQQLPVLDLLFSTRYGEPRAQRSFTAREYLHGNRASSRELAAHSEIQISLLLQDPGRDAINYSARLRSVIEPTH
jgi:hypothetical protein